MPSVPSADTRFRALFDAHNADIRAFCHRRLPVDDANEASSEVFLVAWRRIDQMPVDGETLLWLYGVARNVVRNQQRSGRRRTRLAQRTRAVAVVPDDGPDIQVIRSEEHTEVNEAITSLPDTDRDLLQLKIWEGLPNDEVASVLGISKRAVEGRYTRALKKIARYLDRGDAEGGSSFSAERGGTTT